VNLLLAIKALAGMTLAFSLVYWIVRANRDLAADTPTVDRIAPALLLLSAPALGTTMLLGNLGPVIAGFRVASFAVFLGALLAIAATREDRRADAARGIVIVTAATLLLRVLSLGR
jgi:hypothetical protein